METSESTENLDFVRSIVAEDLKDNKNDGKIITRFPPEPNGYLHIGHAKSICLNFGIANENKGGVCHLRFDDTNPSKEDLEYEESIIKDVKWLGFDWKDKLFYASDYYEKFYNYAVELIKKGKAFVCNLTADEIREYRGTLTEPGKNSPYRDRSIDENLELFEKMKTGDFEEGSAVLRAKIDMLSANLNMRDPVIYRIVKKTHHRTGDKWCIYPMYDFAHCLEDSIENITHSICTLEFEDHRPLYDWILDELELTSHPQQIEFARLNLTNTVMSKRKLLALVEDRSVHGWDDPRMPTISGLRRRGYTPEAIYNFCSTIGVTKYNSTTDVALLEHCLRDDLNKRAQRVMAVLNPLKVVVENYPEGLTEEMDAINNPEDATMGTRKVPFTKVIYIEKGDFMENPPKKFFRLGVGREVRLRYAYFITCTDVIKDENGEVIELRCTYDPTTKGGSAPDGRKVKGTLHWVSAEHGVKSEVREFDYLFTKNEEDEDSEYELNPDSLKLLKECYVEPNLNLMKPGSPLQFERLGYFCADSKDFTEAKPVFNRTVTLKDTWAKIKKKKK